jgi:hypothetical protein
LCTRGLLPKVLRGQALTTHPCLVQRPRKLEFIHLLPHVT